MRPSLRQVLFRSAAGLDLNFAGGVFSLNNTRTASPAAIPGWSFSRTDTNGTATALDLAGNVIQFATGVPRITNRGILVEEARTNKLTVRNATPVSATTNTIKTGDVLSVLTLETDTAALAAAGLSGVVGQVWRLNNTAGVSTATVAIDGVTGNVNNHTLSAYVRGTGDVRVRLNGVNITATPLTAAYVRRTTTSTPPDSGNLFSIWVAAGGDCYFTLPQLEEGAFATSPIITTGAAGTRVADSPISTGLAMLLNGTSPNTVIIDAEWVSRSDTRIYAEGYTGGSQSGATFQSDASGTRPRLINRTGATRTDSGSTAAIISNGATVRLAIVSDGRLASQGVVLASGASPAQADWSGTLAIGHRYNAGTPQFSCCTYIRRVQVLPYAATDAQLQALTAP